MSAGAAQLATIVLQAAPFGWLGGMTVALSVMVAMLAYTAGFRLRRHAQPARFGLLALRLSAITCLFLALLHPGCVTERTTLEKPTVAVVLDDSASMSRADGATKQQRQEQASGHRQSTPYERATTLLRDNLAPALGDTHRLRIYDVEGRLLPPDDIPGDATDQRSPLTDTLLRVQRDSRDGAPVAIALLSDGAEATDQPAFGSLEQLHIPVHPIDLAPAGASGSASAGGNVPAAIDVAIEAVTANRSALVGNTVRVVADMAIDGDPGDTPLVVSILHGDEICASQQVAGQEQETGTKEQGAGNGEQDVVQSSALSSADAGQAVVQSSALRPADRGQENTLVRESPLAPPARRLLRAELEFVPRTPGSFTYLVAVRPCPGETALANNRQTFPLAVRAKPLTVMYIDGVLRWEGKFVRETLAADPDINLISSVRTAHVGADHGSPGLLLAQQLADVDVVIIGDVEANYFSPNEELAALCRWVADGGGLLLTGGYHSFGPRGFHRRDTGATLADVLPVELSAAPDAQIEHPLNIRLTDAGREHPIFQLTGDRLRDTAFIQKLPALSGCSRVAGVKPGAEVLALAADVRVAEGAEDVPILVVQQVGDGRAAVLTVDTTWRWRMVVGGFTGDHSFYERFWGQLVRWLASAPEDAPQRLSAFTQQQRYQPGDEIELGIHLDRDDQEATGRRPVPHAWNVRATAIDERGTASKVPLAELGDGQYRGSLVAAQPGRYELFVRATPVPSSEPAADVTAESRVISVQVERPDPELFNARPDPQWLARVAQLSGGHVVQPDEIAAWARRLPAQPIRKTVQETSGFRGDFLFGGAFLTLMCAEWIARRRSQLV